MVTLKFCSLIIGILLAVLKPTSAADAVSAVDCSGDATVCDSIKNATCDPNTSKCKCKTGYKEGGNDHSSCIKDAVSAVDCSGDATVCDSIKNLTCDPNTSKCKCKTGYEEGGNDHSSCIKVVSTTTCTNGSPCTGKANSVCKSGTCICKDGFVMKANTCTKVVGSNCSGPAACAGDTNSVCLNSKCVCKKDYDEKDGVCAQTVSGTTCTVSGKECDVINNAECDGKKCKCSSGYTMKVDVCAAENAAPSMELGRVALPLSILMLTLLKKLF